MATVIELAGRTEPTERSSCPAIINNPIGSAMMPSSEATLSQLAAPPADRKFSPPKTEKKTKTATRPMSDPVSGRRTSAPSDGVEEGEADGSAATLDDGLEGLDVMGTSSMTSPESVTAFAARRGDARPSDASM